MIVHQPTQAKSNGHIKVASRFEMQQTIPYLPKELWYCFPERYAGHVNSRPDAFIPTALLMAMYTGEDLSVRGAVSPRLAYNLFEYMEIFHSWYPKHFKRVNITFNRLEAPAQPISKTRVATAFSGGVDSFYSLWAHLAQNQSIPDARVTHGLFVHGLDLRLEDKANYKSAADSYELLFNELGLNLIQAATNAYQFSEFRINWTLFYSAPLIGAALLLSPWLHRFFIPSGGLHYQKLFKEGSSPIMDHLLSNETTEIIHHGASITRLQKFEVLSKWPTTYHKIRVCSDKTSMHGVQNCSACHKCYRTKILLEMLDALPNYKNFSQNKLSLIDYIRWGAIKPLNKDIVANIKKQAIQHHRYGIAFGLQIAIYLRTISLFLRTIFLRLLSEKQIYSLKRKIFNPETDDLS
jgi:hypothetical protein